jgi:glycosyltransferase involved in cell wall biosynthesis
MKLSVITICFNEKDTISQTIESVLNQSFTDYEYIIIDGNSNDGTYDIIRGYFNHFKKIVSEPDNGIFDAMNKALDFAEGDYIFFLNAGDILVNKNVFENIFSKSNSEDIIYGDVIFKYASGIMMRRKSPRILSPQYFFVDSLNHQTTFMNRKLMTEIGHFDTSLKITADYDVILNAVFDKKCSTCYVSLPVTYFNLSGISSNPEFFMLQNKERLICLKRYFSEKEIKKMEKWRILNDLIHKKTRYSYFLFLSIISKRFLYGK